MILSSQSGAAFLAAAFDNQTAGTGGHAGEEADAAFTTTVGGLESSFHFLYLLFMFLALFCFVFLIHPDTITPAIR